MDFETWYNLNRHQFSDDLNNEMEKHADVLHFYLGIYNSIINIELPPLLHRLMREQYPVFEKETRPKVLNEINDIATTTGVEFLFKMRTVLKDQTNGVNFRQKYPKFQEWIDFYGAPPQPTKMTDDKRHTLYRYEKYSDEAWEALKASEDAISLRYHNYTEKRKTQFYEVLQPLVFKYWPELPELMDSDAWILYAVNIRDEYDYYQTLCEHIETFIDYDFPEEYLALSNAEYNKIKYEAYKNSNRKYHDELHERRLNGERI